MHRRNVLVALGAAFFWSACSSATRSSVPANEDTSSPALAPETKPEERSTATLDCAHVIQEIDEVPEGMPSIEGVVAFAVGSDWQLETVSRYPSSEQLFAKSGLLVRTESAFELRVPEGESTRIRWGNRADPVSVFRVPACPGTGGWLAFPGGYWVSKPGCAKLIVRHQGRDTDVRIGVGAPCPASP